MPQFQHIFDSLHQLDLVDGLGEKVVGASFDSSFDVAQLTEGGHHQDHDAPGGWVSLELLADLEARETLELSIIAEFMPEQLGMDEIEELVSAAIAESGAGSMQDMGRVMALLKPRVQGKADMAQVSGLVKSQLT